MHVRSERLPFLAIPLVCGFAFASVGWDCGGGGTGGNDGGAPVDSATPPLDAGPSADAADAGPPVAATCAGICACLAAACPDYPFLPDCVTACEDPTNNPVWDLSCRASMCSQAYGDGGAYCPSASGQTKCH